MKCLSVLALLCGALLASCSTSTSLPAGMTKQEVATQVGKPLRVEKHKDGGESWIYNSVQKKRVVSTHHNAALPEETVYERDLRLDSQGVSGGVEFSTVESYEERPLRFDSAGRLLGSPDFMPLPQ